MFSRRAIVIGKTLYSWMVNMLINIKRIKFIGLRKVNSTFCGYAALAFLGIHGYDVNVAAAAYQPAKIAIVGSSTAAGTGATDYAHAWVGLYTTNLASLNSSNRVVNLAVGGYTTYHTLPTGTINPANRPAVDPAHNITAALATQPNAVIINLPSNDAANGYSEAETETNFLKMAATCLASNVPVWIATTQPRNLSAAGRTNLMDVMAWIISTFPTSYLDFWSTIANPDGTINATYSAGDGIHLNNAGHQVLFSRVVASRLYELVSGPRTLTIQAVSETVELGFDTLPGVNYVLESSPDFEGWQTVTNTAGDGTLKSLDLPEANAISFFRLRLEPAP
jgi:lysophospholipase L1-like esterase